MKPKLKVREPSPFKTNVLKERGKNREPTTRAARRARTMALVKEVTDLLAMLGPHKAEAVKVLADQLKAIKPLKNPQGFVTEWIPDEIIRQKAAIAIFEWLEGKPRELQIQMTGKPEDFEKALEIAREVQARQSLQKTVQGKEIPSALPDTAREQGEQAG